MKIQFYIIPDKTTYWVEEFKGIPRIGDHIAVMERGDCIVHNISWVNTSNKYIPVLSLAGQGQYKEVIDASRL